MGHRICARAQAGLLLGSARIPASGASAAAHSPADRFPSWPAIPKVLFYPRRHPQPGRPRAARRFLPGAVGQPVRPPWERGHAWERARRCAPARPTPSARAACAPPARPAQLPSTGRQHCRRIFKRSFIATRELPSKIFNGPPGCQSKRGCCYTPHPPTLLTSHLLRAEV